MAYLTPQQKAELEAAGLAHIVAKEAGEVPAGTLKMFVRKDETGREIREFKGSKSVWMDAYKSAPLLQVKINNRDVDQGEARAIINQFRRDQAQLADFAKNPSQYRIDVSSTKQTLTKQG
jgi:hypothetical protein